MPDQIISRIGLQLYKDIIVEDAEGLWRKLACDESEELGAVEVRHVSNEMELRRVYEWEIEENPNQRFVIVIDGKKVYVPADISKKCHIYRLTFDNLLPNLDSRAMRDLPGIDINRVMMYANMVGHQKMEYDGTMKFCLDTVMKDPCFAKNLMAQAVKMSEYANTHREWSEIAIMYGRAAHFHHTVDRVDDFDAKRYLIEKRFMSWMSTKYGFLSGSVDNKRPVLLSKVADFLRKESDKVALIVMDGMSFENFYTVQDYFIKEPFEFVVSSSYSFLPSVTSVARQSIFSGQLPRENSKPFSLDNEERQWMDYWKNVGIRSNEIGFYKSDHPEYDKRMRVLGIIVNICDDLMHAELQGLCGLNQGVINWLKTGALKRLLMHLISDGYKVFMTSDHGNTSAIGQGRFIKPGLVAEPASRRAVIYQSFDDAVEMSKFNTTKYGGSYLPDGFDVYTFDVDACYGDVGKEYITHGGMTIEEMIVPFVKIGEING